MNRLSAHGLRGALAAWLTVLTMATAAAQAGDKPLQRSLDPAMPVPREPHVPPVAARPLGGAMAVPGFWDPRHRPERPDLTRINLIRFLTETDYPPFNYTGPDGTPTGFNVELARSICHVIHVACTIQMRRFDTLVDALNARKGDAVIASLAETPELRKKVDFSHPYYRTPARFVARRNLKGLKTISTSALEGRTVAVVAGTAHEAYLKNVFTGAVAKPYPTAAAARAALKDGKVDLLFGDGISLSFWLNGSDSAGCCEFRGGPYLESRYFGEGVGIAVRKGNTLLRQAFNWALFKLWENGRFTDLWLRYFPISPF